MSTLYEEIARFEENEDKFNILVNGAANQTVTLGGTTHQTLNGLLAYLESSVFLDAAVQAATACARYWSDEAADSATSAADSATSAAGSAASAARDAESAAASAAEAVATIAAVEAAHQAIVLGVANIATTAARLSDRITVVEIENIELRAAERLDDIEAYARSLGSPLSTARIDEIMMREVTDV